VAGFEALKSAHKWLVLKRPMTLLIQFYENSGKQLGQTEDFELLTRLRGILAKADATEPGM
jgi:hypothetical protein